MRRARVTKHEFVQSNECELNRGAMGVAPSTDEEFSW